MHYKKSSVVCKKPSNFSFIVADSIEMINNNHWNSIVGDENEFLQLSYLKAIEKEHPDNMHFHYAIIYDKKAPIAITYFQVIDFSSENFETLVTQENEDFACSIAAYLKKHFTSYLRRNKDKINMRLLICGNAFISGEHGFAFAEGINKADTFDVLADVIHAVGKMEKLRGRIAAVLIKDFYSYSLKISKILEKYKYHDFLVEPNMILSLNRSWHTFDDYLNAMAKKYRNRAKSILKKGNDIERKDFNVADILHYSKQIQRLYNNVHLKAKFRLASLTTDYFAEMKKQMPEKFRFTAYFYNGKFVGFRSSFILKNIVEAHFIGLDYEVNKDIELYQNMLYDYVKETFITGKQRLHLGRTASEIKSTIGAKAYPLTCYVKHSNILSSKIISPFIEHLKPVTWFPRSPFKEIETAQS